jgi:soluble lytic murein transglycosylase-like protein
MNGMMNVWVRSLFVRRLMTLVVGALLSALSMGVSDAAASAVWEFVDRNGVVHMGNVAPPAAREVVWLEGVGSVVSDKPKGSVRQPLSSPKYESARPVLEEAARAQALEPALVIAVAAAESAFNSEAVSRKGALGLMQVMPATAQRYGVTARRAQEAKQAVMEPKLNAHIGTRYLADLLRMFDGDKELALAAYNAGEGAVTEAWEAHSALSGDPAVRRAGPEHLPFATAVIGYISADGGSYSIL